MLADESERVWSWNLCSCKKKRKIWTEWIEGIVATQLEKFEKFIRVQATVEAGEESIQFEKKKK